MDFFGSVAGFLREGAADVFGLRPELDALREANADARLLARRIEDVNWTNIFNGASGGAYFDPEAKERKEQTRRAYQYYFNDPIVRRSVDLRNYYVFGKGIGEPKYRPDPRRPPEEAELGRHYIGRYWNDAENRKALTGYQAQYERARERQLQSNIFLLLVRSNEQARLVPRPDEEGITTVDADPVLDAETSSASAESEPATMKVSDLTETEIVDVLTHPGNKKIPLLYKRVWTPMVFDRSTDTYAPAEQPKIRYYRDWEFGTGDLPTEWPEGSGQPWGPDPSKIAPVDEGVVYHVSTNKTSDMKFGITETQSYLKWAQGLNQYMTSRMSTVQAIAAIAMQVKTRGGAKNVSQMAGQIQDLSRLAGKVEGGPQGAGQSGSPLDRVRADQGRTKFAVSNRAGELQPMIQDTSAGNAIGDIGTMKNQVAAGSGIPSYQLGGEAPGLSSTTSMDAPLQKMCEADQEAWETIHTDLTRYMIKGVGLDPARVEVNMPPLLQRDVGSLVAYLTGLLATVDPNVSNAELIRFVFAEVLDAMGKVNTRELVESLFPQGFKTPYEQQIEQALLQAQLMQQAVPGGGDGNQSSQAQLAAGSVADAAATQQRSGGQPNMPNSQAGDYPSIARDRAAGRRERALQASSWTARREDFVSGLEGPLQEVARDAFRELDALIGQHVGQ